MKLSTRGQYAVAAMADLARFSQAQGASKPVSLRDIALRQGISLTYLEQLFGKLRRHGLVFGQRGPGGGYRLAAAPAQTRVLDIMFAVDEPIKTTRCDGDRDHGCARDHARCLTHDLWSELGHMIEMFLGSVSLDDVINRRNLSPYGITNFIQNEARKDAGKAAVL